MLPSAFNVMLPATSKFKEPPVLSIVPAYKFKNSVPLSFSLTSPPSASSIISPATSRVIFPEAPILEPFIERVSIERLVPEILPLVKVPPFKLVLPDASINKAYLLAEAE